MGNRAIIACSSAKTAPAIYVHWNGGPESIIGFLKAAEYLGVRAPGNDPEYFLARLGQIIGNYFGGTISLGFGLAGRMDDSDNGIYVVGPGFEIKSRTYKGKTTYDGLSDEEREKCIDVMLDAIDKSEEFFKGG